jgi:hypothetical protein
VPATPSRECTDCATMVPRRSRTRAQNRALRIAAERRLNRQHRETQLGRRRWEEALAMSAIKDEPPPFLAPKTFHIEQPPPPLAGGQVCAVIRGSAALG